MYCGFEKKEGACTCVVTTKNSFWKRLIAQPALIKACLFDCSKHHIYKYQTTQFWPSFKLTTKIQIKNQDTIKIRTYSLTVKIHREAAFLIFCYF